ncbi:MAG: hypothetical protein ABIQ93_14275, partial [Saprospiraceae bacterium]
AVGNADFTGTTDFRGFKNPFLSATSVKSAFPIALRVHYHPLARLFHSSAGLLEEIIQNSG